MELEHEPRTTEPEPLTPSFQIVSMARLATAEFIPPDFIIDPLIPVGVVTMLGGHGGAGKSALALVLGVHVACGRPWAGFNCRKGKVLYVSLEDPPDLVLFRLSKIVDHYGLSMDEVTDWLSILDGSETDSALAVEQTDITGRRLIETRAFTELRELAKGFQLIMIDNASDAFDGNENERRQVRRFMKRMLGAIAAENNAAVLLLAHIDKSAARNGSGGNSFSGSTAWHNSSRSRLALIVSNDQIELHNEKMNLGRKAEALRLQWSTTGVIEPATASPDHDAGVMTGPDVDIVLAAIQAATRDGVQISTSRSGPGNAMSTLMTFGIPEHFRAEKGRRFWAALTKLQRTGTVDVETFKDRWRKDKGRIVLKDAA